MHLETQTLFKMPEVALTILATMEASELKLSASTKARETQY